MDPQHFRRNLSCRRAPRFVFEAQLPSVGPSATTAARPTAAGAIVSFVSKLIEGDYPVRQPGGGIRDAGIHEMKRQYESQQNCPIARSLDLVGDRWTILVLRDLHLGRTRFADLLRSLDGISPNLLSARLKTLEHEELVARRLYSEHPPRAEYVLTERGQAFGAVLRAMSDWGSAFRPVEAAV